MSAQGYLVPFLLSLFYIRYRYGTMRYTDRRWRSQDSYNKMGVMATLGSSSSRKAWEIKI